MFSEQYENCNKSSFTLESKSRWYDETSLIVLSYFSLRWVIFDRHVFSRRFIIFLACVLFWFCFNVEEFDGKLVLCFGTRNISNILISFPFQSKFTFLARWDLRSFDRTKEHDHKTFDMEQKISVVIRKKRLPESKRRLRRVYTKRRRSNRIKNVWCFREEVKTIIIDLTHEIFSSVQITGRAHRRLLFVIRTSISFHFCAGFVNELTTVDRGNLIILTLLFGGLEMQEKLYGHDGTPFVEERDVSVLRYVN